MDARDEVEASDWGPHKIKARFMPKRMDNLRDCMRQVIGKTFLFVYAGAQDDGELYAGQKTFVFDRQHDAELGDEAAGRWVPLEDLDEIEIVKR